MNGVGEEFDTGRLVGVIEAHRARPAQAIADAIFSAVYEFCGGAEQKRRPTVVVLKITGIDQGAGQAIRPDELPGYRGRRRRAAPNRPALRGSDASACL